MGNNDFFTSQLGWNTKEWSLHRMLFHFRLYVMKEIVNYALIAYWIIQSQYPPLRQKWPGPWERKTIHFCEHWKFEASHHFRESAGRNANLLWFLQTVSFISLLLLHVNQRVSWGVVYEPIENWRMSKRTLIFLFFLLFFWPFSLQTFIFKTMIKELFEKMADTLC